MLKRDNGTEAREVPVVECDGHLGLVIRLKSGRKRAGWYWIGVRDRAMFRVMPTPMPDRSLSPIGHG